MRLRKERVFPELCRTIDAIPRRGEVGQHGRIGPLQMKYDRGRIGRVYTGDRSIVGLADRQDALRRVDDAFVARLHIHEGQGRPVMKQHIAA